MTMLAQQTAGLAPRRGGRLLDAIEAGLRRQAVELSVAFPATVIAFDTTTGLAEVEADFSHILQLDQGEQQLDPMRLMNVLVEHPGQGEVGGGYLTFPVLAGAKGSVTVFDRSVDRWKQRGEGGDPGMRHTHNRIDGVFRPGLRDKSRAIPSFDQTSAVLEHASILLGKSASLKAARDTDSVAAGTTVVVPPALNMAGWIAGVTAFINGVAPGTLTPPVDFGNISNGSTKVRIE